MTTTTRTTELEAINTMLSCIGESPINALTVSGIEHVDSAKSILDRTSRAVQKLGWHFNSEKNYPLIRNVGGELLVPPNAARIDSSSNFSAYDVTQRGDKLYNKTTRSTVFDKDIEVDVVFILPFEELPQDARDYIMIRAARVFQREALGVTDELRFSEADEAHALAALQKSESEAGDLNMFTGSNSVANILRR